MGFEVNQNMVDWVVGIRRNKNGKILEVFDSRKKSALQRINIALKYILLGQKHHNTMCNAGFAVTSGLINGVAGTAFTYTAIGTGTTNSAATDTQMQTEAKRKVGTQSQSTTTVTNDTSVWDATFSSGDGLSGTTAITEVGIFNASSNGALLVHFASTVVMATCVWANGDTFEAIVKIQSKQGT
jgi:hypothetical protein